MPPSVTRNYEGQMRNVLANYFGRLQIPNLEVKTQWPAKIKLEDDAYAYSPKVDIAVGPFAEERNFRNTYDRICERTRNLTTVLQQDFRENFASYHTGIVGDEFPPVIGPLSNNSRPTLTR